MKSGKMKGADMGLQAKFNLTLSLIFLVGLLLSGAVSYHILQENAREAVLQNARIMRHGADAIRAYTAEQLEPLLLNIPRDDFLPQTVPSYSAISSFQGIQKSFPEYDYTEVALNPTNLENKANSWESGLIETFRRNPGLKEIVEVLNTSDGQILMLAHPIQVTDETCLICHSTPEVAPEPMLAAYGSENGFGWQMNEIIGAQIMSVPMAVPLERARHAFLSFMGVLVAVFVVLFVIMNVAIQSMVIKRVLRISDLAGQVSMGNSNVPEVRTESRDEIGTLIASFNRMRRSLDNAMKMIEA